MVTSEGTQSTLESLKSCPAKVCSVALEATVKANGAAGPKAGRSDPDSVFPKVGELLNVSEVKSVTRKW